MSVIAGPSVWRPLLPHRSTLRLSKVVSPPPLPHSSPSLCLPIRSRAFHSTPPTSSGSNRWSKIRHKKAILDSMRSNVFGRLTNDIVVAIRSGGPSPESNLRLALALKKAKELNYPKDRLESTLAKADKSGETLTTVIYDVLGPFFGASPGSATQPATVGTQIALLIECSTDSPSRTNSKIKEIFNKSISSNYRLSSVSHLFYKTGVIRLAIPATPSETQKGQTFDEVFELALEHGAEEVREVEAENETQAKIVQEGGKIIEILSQPVEVNPISSHLTSYNLLEAEQRSLPIGPWLRIRDEPEEGETGAGKAAAGAGAVGQAATDAHVQGRGEIQAYSMPEGETAGWVDEESLAKLDRLAEVLENEADCTRIWSNLYAWP